MTTTDHTLGHFVHIDLKSSLKLRLSTRFGVILSSSSALPLTRSQLASNSAVLSDSHSWVSKGQQISLSICLRIKDTRIGDQDIEEFGNVVAKILAKAELWSQLGFECYIDSVATSSLQKKAVDIRLTLHSHHDLRDTDHTYRAKSIPDAPVPPGVPTIRLNSITVDLGLSAWPSHIRTIADHETLRDPSIPSTLGHCRAHDLDLPGLTTIINLLDASLRRLMFGHSVSKVQGIVEEKGVETKSLFQLAPSILCPDFRKGIALRASTASNIACSLSRMSRRARSEELGEARVRKLKSSDRLHHPRRGEKVQDHPASMQSIIEVRLWNLMLDYLPDPRAHKNIKPLQMPDNLQELWPQEDEMLEDMDLQITRWPASSESQRVEDAYVSSEATIEEMLDDAAEDDLVPRFDCLDDEPSSGMMLDDDLVPSFVCLDDERSSEMMLDDDLIPSYGYLDDERSSEMMLDDELAESGALSSEGSFEDLMAMPVYSQRTISTLNDIAADSWWEPGGTPVYEESLGSHALTSRADSEEGLDETSSMPDSEEMLDSSFSTIENEAFAFSDPFDDEEQLSPGRLELEDEDDLLDP